MQDFRNVKVWQKAYMLALDVYRATGSFPLTEIYGLTAQVRRAAVSIGANIAEGCGRGSDGDFRRFLAIAFGSLNEVHHCLLLSRDLRFLALQDFARFEPRIDELRKMLISFVDKLKAHSS